ncbi:Protein NRT1/ PTR FAMILY 5.2 [Capsicum baccatum]|uniref:Protein NRT1/ PTR FAMILY 5.2 n=1 Tax=Capsicum baccatum TaxID=33114 RepID=A0A2G2W4H4_CAPBA|nr:Protein NRT1/ PTR FAMILY 5.2 [Capsicum baccatum]
MTSLGIGNFISSFLLSTVSDITKKHGNHRGWILNNLNASHLDYYYAFFAILNLLNFIFFLFVSKFYVYKAEVSDSLDVLRQELEIGSKHRVTNSQEASTNTQTKRERSIAAGRGSSTMEAVAIGGALLVGLWPFGEVTRERERKEGR